MGLGVACLYTPIVYINSPKKKIDTDKKEVKKKQKKRQNKVKNNGGMVLGGPLIRLEKKLFPFHKSTRTKPMPRQLLKPQYLV